MAGGIWGNEIRGNMKTVAISGGFDPIHSGHIKLINEAATYGKVIVILNSDDWLMRKKGKPFMSWEERKEIVENIAMVWGIEIVDDRDGTVCEALERIKPDYFANGGDRTADNTPELVLCEKLGIIPLFNIGGEKTQSSSKLLNDYIQKGK